MIVFVYRTGLIFVAGYSIYSSRAQYSFEVRRKELEELEKKDTRVRSLLSSQEWYEATEKKIVSSELSDGGTLREELLALIASPVPQNELVQPSESIFPVTNRIESKSIDKVPTVQLQTPSSEKDSKSNKPKKSSYNISL